MNSSSTNVLLSEVELGNSTAKQKLFQKLRSMLKKEAAVRMDHGLRTRVDPSDVAQEVLMLADVRLEQYLSNRPIAFVSWMKQLVKEVVVSLYRRHKHTQSRDYRMEIAFGVPLNFEAKSTWSRVCPPWSNEPSVQAIEKEGKRALMSAFESLSTQDREIIRMRYFEHLTCQQVADALGISLSASKMRHLRAIEQLRTILDVSKRRMS